MRTLALALAALACLSATSGVGVAAAAGPPRWTALQSGAYGSAQYVVDFARTYATPEEAAIRHALITARLEGIRRHNAGPSRYKKARGVLHVRNPCADMTALSRVRRA